MSADKDLLLAILSMDAYNRGYGSGVADGGANDPDGLGETGQIGNATIVPRQSVGIGPDELQAWQNAGFYAVAYEVQAGAWEGLAEDTTVISFRGTDRAFGWTGSDAWNGWGIGAGAFEGDQARAHNWRRRDGPAFSKSRFVPRQGAGALPRTRTAGPRREGRPLADHRTDPVYGEGTSSRARHDAGA